MHHKNAFCIHFYQAQARAGKAARACAVIGTFMAGARKKNVRPSPFARRRQNIKSPMIAWRRDTKSPEKEESIPHGMLSP